MRKVRHALLALTVGLVSCGPQLGGRGHDNADDDPLAGDQERLGATSNTHISAGIQHACAIFGGGKVLCWGDNTYGQLGSGSTAPAYAPVVVPGISTATQVAAGFNHTCARLSDATVKCWGRNNTGQLGIGTFLDTAVPTTVALGNVQSVATGGGHSCAIVTGGGVYCWGDGTFGQLGNGVIGIWNVPVPIIGSFSATEIAAGENHTCGVAIGGSVWCAGANFDGQLGYVGYQYWYYPLWVQGSLIATNIATGNNHTCVRLATGNIACWGRGTSGQIGNGGTGNAYLAVGVSGITTALNVSGGGNNTCARLSDNSMKCWGANTYGQVGDGTTTQRNTPASVTALGTNVAHIATGGEYSCAHLSNDNIKCWGRNDSGELSQGTSALMAKPTEMQPATLNRVMSISQGLAHTCALWDTGGIKCWGANTYGQLGNGTTTASTAPVDVTGITNAVSVFSGAEHSCAALSTGAVKCWGRNANGQLGNNTTADQKSPVSVSGITNATQVTAAHRHSCARLADGTIKCWGRNADGELGNGTSGGNKLTPVAVSGVNNALAVAAGSDNVADNIFFWSFGSGHTCALLGTEGNASVKCWGRNQYGQLGNGTTNNATSPVQVSGLTTGVNSIAVGMYHSCAQLAAGGVKCWGYNASGQLGNGNNTNQTSPADVTGITNAAGIGIGGIAHHTCAPLSDKTMRCWGKNDRSQLGDLTITNSNLPVVVSGVRRAVSVATGSNFSCARLDDSTIQCWGDNSSAQLTAGHQVAYTTPTDLPCRPTSITRSDYFLDYTTANMPDSQFNGLTADLDVHRVSPVMFPESCTPAKAAVLVHGRTVEAAAAFDLQYQDYSFMEQLAWSGVDVVTFNHLGMGRSRIPSADALANACNSSLPACLDIGQTCPPPNGVLCDCGPVPTFGINDKNQQGSTRYMNPNPLSALCAHSTNTRFINTTTMVEELDRVVNDTLSKTGLSKVNLLGYSAGGVVVGNYLGTADNTARAAHTAKTERAIFVSSLFGPPTVGETEPTGGSSAHSYPMGLMDRTSATAGGFNLAVPICPGQRDDDIVDPIWAAVKARDTVGAGWGPTQTPAENGGLSRFPQATRWGWTATSAARITVPVLVMQGLKDNVISVATSAALYAALTGTASKTIVQIGCASHSIFWEGCSGLQCNSWTGPHFTVFKNSRDWINTGMIYASPGSTNGAFESDDSDGANGHTSGPTSSGPAADEGNQLP
jgi:alpha-tubulin suppressor-like RCC1 family protein/pimeloyl-ACP methyl ester carboxylesterase